MPTEDLEPFRSVPFLLWAKDADGVEVWGNRTIDDLAGGPVAGKPDGELAWAEDAETTSRCSAPASPSSCTSTCSGPTAATPC